MFSASRSSSPSQGFLDKANRQTDKLGWMGVDGWGDDGAVHYCGIIPLFRASFGLFLDQIKRGRWRRVALNHSDWGQNERIIILKRRMNGE